MEAQVAPQHFPAHPRFAYRGVLGRGGMGVVYRVHDREIEQDVALKTLDDREQARLLKREFRAVVDLTHPNLVEIYELFAGSRQSFFTMELLEGVDFVRFVRGDGSAPTAGSLPQDALARVVGGFGQLVEGVAAIHAAGMLHRDIKTSNVMVCPAEAGERHRVVLLDFGLVTSVAPRAGTSAEFAGTPASMPPEQLWGQPLSAASDWYGVGTLLYEALTGAVPDLRSYLFGAGPKHIEPPGARTAGVPAWLDALVVELLTPDPKARPAEVEIRKRIARARTPAWHDDGRVDAAQRRADGTQGPHLSGPSEEVFVGRRHELAQLRDAFDDVRGGGTGAVLVSGVSGIGKTELLRQFTQRLRAQAEVVALCGRCHPRESIPFAGFDQVVDDLVEHLASLDPGSEDVVPEHAPQLLRLFPAFQAAPTFSRLVADQGPSEPHVLRHLAAGALREILIRLAAHRPIVLWIDDLQWTDEDSSFLLRSILRPPVPARLLMMLSYRSEERSDNDVLRDVVRFVTTAPGLRVREIEARPLEPDESVQLVSELLERLGAEPGHLQRDIARESEGSPFFIGELVRHHAQTTVRRDGASEPVPVHIQDVVRRRFDALRAIERRLLEAVAVAGAPIARDVALRAIGLGAAGRAVAGALEKQCLLRSSLSAGASA
jgi:eukaryotic-like serine/threonine-protein kinase